MPSNSYDLVVLGDDLTTALVCATLCARRGLRTLVLGDERPVRYTLGPHKLPVEPASWPTGTGSGGERVLKELHAELALRRKLREPEISTSSSPPSCASTSAAIASPPSSSAKVEPRAADWLARWDRASEIARLFDPALAGEHAFPGVGFFERRRKLAKLTDAGRRRGLRHLVGRRRAPIRTAHSGASSRRSRCGPSDPAPIAIARAVDAWRTGPVALRG